MEERKKAFSYVSDEEVAKIRKERGMLPKLFSIVDNQTENNIVSNSEKLDKMYQNAKEIPIKAENTECNEHEMSLAQASIFAQQRHSATEITSSNLPIQRSGMAQMTAYPQVAREKERKSSFNYEATQFVYDGKDLYALDDRRNNRRIGNFAVKIQEEKIIIDEIVNEANEIIGKNENCVWKISILIGSLEFSGVIRSEELYDYTWLRRVSHERAIFDSTTENKRLLRLYLQKLIIAEQYAKMHEYTSAGWKYLSDGKMAYVTAQGAIGFENLPIKAEDRFSLIRSNNQNLQDVFQQFYGMRHVVSGNIKNAIFLQYYTLTSLMTSLFKQAGFQIEFCVGAIGKTNTKKTSCSEIFSRVFNRTPSAVPDINFSATEAAIFEVMDKYADQIVLIDDLTPSENDSDAREKIRKLENIIRAYGDRVPRRRSISYSSNSNAKEFTPITGCALLTGETFSGGKSSRSRVAILRFEEGDVNSEVLTYYQQNLHVLPDFVYEFLRYITNNIERVKATISSTCMENRKNKQLSIKMPRFQDALGVLYATSNIFYGFIVENGLMDEQSARTLVENDREMLKQVIVENDSEVATVSPGITILEALKDCINTGKISVKSIEAVVEKKVDKELLYDANYFYITSERLWECTKAYTDYRKIYFPYKKGRELIEPLKNEELLLVRREGNSQRASHKIVINGKIINQRYLYLNKEKVEKIWKNLELV